MAEVKETREVPIVFCTDEKYALYLPPLVQSVIEHSSPDRHYRIIVLDCGIKTEDLAVLKRQISRYSNFSLTVRPISSWLKQHGKSLAQKGRFPPAMYGRLLIPELFPDYEKIIYADIDFVIQRDIAELLNLDLEENYIAASADIPRDIYRARGDDIETGLGLSDGDYYINSGFLVFNIKTWLENKISQKCIDRLERHDLSLPDQDAINIICKGKIRHLHQGWNVLGLMPALMEKESFTTELTRAALVAQTVAECKEACRSGRINIHYAGSWRKPWFFPDVPSGQIWWHYAAKTEFYARYVYDLNASPEKERVLAYCLAKTAPPPTCPPDEPATREGKVYYFLGIPLLTVKVSADSKKYCLGNFGGKMRFLMVKKQGNAKAVYLFGIHLGTVKSKKEAGKGS